MSEINECPDSGFMDFAEQERRGREVLDSVGPEGSEERADFLEILRGMHWEVRLHEKSFSASFPTSQINRKYGRRLRKYLGPAYWNVFRETCAEYSELMFEADPKGTQRILSKEYARELMGF